MKFKTTSLALLTSIALYSVSPLNANFLYEEYNPLCKHLRKMGRCKRISTGEVSGQEAVAEHYRKKISQVRAFSKDIDTKITNELDPIHKGALVSLQGEAALLIENFYSKPSLMKAEKEGKLTRKEVQKKQEIKRKARKFFEEAKKHYESGINIKDSEKFQETYKSGNGPFLFGYARSIRYLVDLTKEENINKKVSYLGELANVTEELLKRPNMVVNHYFVFTPLVRANRWSFRDYNNLDEYLVANQEAVLSAIQFEKNWIEHPQEGIRYEYALAEYLDAQKEQKNMKVN
ncbi:MAG: hypothetical protein BGO67_01720 [Alphaproteobacteria bacterium 41-28]|nr:MAG: hypothetical protein BGO67_01720 [Alphaproteobacteria bacterium 41-28]